MGIQMNLLGGVESSIITAQVAIVSETSTSTVDVSITFGATGDQFTTINGSNTILGDWVTPKSSADLWEIRATLDSGATPNGSALGTWLPLTTSRTWGLTRSDVGESNSVLTFEFRKAGGSSAEYTVSLNSLTAEVLDPF
jgi:hypothetical protein